MLRRSRYYFLLGTIIAAGAFMRFYDLGSVSMTADELSALDRLDFSSLGEMIDKGVRPDGHPAFVQVLLWFWIKIFGHSALAIRFPFALVSVFSIWLAAAIARRWFGDACALMTAAIIAFCEFPIMYGQLARPYAFGLFFSLAFASMWTRVLFDEARGRKLHVLALLVLAAAGAMYTHYFSFLFVLIGGCTGLFFLGKKTWLPYLLSGLAAGLLYIPHLGIFRSQLSTGGVGGPGGWLAKPTPGFITDHFAFVFNNSWIVGGAVMAAAALSFGLCFKNKSWNKFQVIAFVWFLLPLVTGYIYSVQRNPVLQHSVLLFTMPFLVMLLFSGLREVHNVAGLTAIVFCIIPATSTVLEKKYELTNHFGRVKDLVVSMHGWSQKYGSGNITFTGNFDGESFTGYYFDRVNWKPAMACTFNDGAAQLYDFRQIVQNSKTDYFAYVWSTRAPSMEILWLIREKYPHLAERNLYFNSESWLFSRKPQPESNPNDTIFTTFENFDQPGKRFAGNEKAILDSCGQKNSRGLKLSKSSSVFGPVFAGKVGEEIKSPDDFISIEANILADSGSAAVAVIEFRRGDSLLLWTGRNYADMHHSFGTWEKFFYAVRMFKEIRKGDEVRVYLFNDRDAAAYADDLHIRVIRGSEVIYGKQEKY
ncbi:MAG: hypothetical protein FD123_1245 [Bacteroidetes bacterium]|nr:MAG: hypothetical protein FD123_1245 [Bacteroidota bacterium]